MGKSDNKLDNHVYNCGGFESLTKKERNTKEPFFDLHIMLTCSDYNKLLSYESKLHASGIDTMNRWYAWYEQRLVKEVKIKHQQQQTNR